MHLYHAGGPCGHNEIGVAGIKYFGGYASAGRWSEGGGGGGGWYGGGGAGNNGGGGGGSCYIRHATVKSGYSTTNGNIHSSNLDGIKHYGNNAGQPCSRHCTAPPGRLVFEFEQ